MIYRSFLSDTDFLCQPFWDLIWVHKVVRFDRDPWFWSRCSLLALAIVSHLEFFTDSELAPGSITFIIDPCTPDDLFSTLANDLQCRGPLITAETLAEWCTVR